MRWPVPAVPVEADSLDEKALAAKLKVIRGMLLSYNFNNH